jgi:hypothetical protein
MYGIPTTYKGIRLRSRTEARWACFFDLLKLSWFYEWTDLRGYIPDFLLEGELLAEVKAATSSTSLLEHADKIVRSGWKGPWVLLGSTYSVQCGRTLTLPENAAALWAEACNVTQWFPSTKPSVEYARQEPCFAADQFQVAALPEPSPLQAQKLFVPELPSYSLPVQPRTLPTPPRLPTK